MTNASAFDRTLALDRLAKEQFDVLIIGGGITGAGVLLDAANRGLTAALVEMDDFASGTSSKSSKLVHGGLRYLQQGEIRLVYEALAERQVLRRIAPHLVQVMPFMIPMFKKNGLLNPKLARALGLAMWQYDLTGGLRIGKRHRRLSKQQALDHMPRLNADNLDSAYLYFDAQADDARLTLEIIRTAVLRYGAVAANRCAVEALNKDADGNVDSATIRTSGGDVININTKCVVNATGVWSDTVRRFDDPSGPDTIRPAKGVHIAIPRHRLDTDVAAVMPVPGDRRSVFVVPWGNVTYVGTTDTDFDGALTEPRCTADDITYLLSALNKSTTGNITEADVIGSWAGLRPLVTGGASGRTADLSRRHSVTISDSGVITVTGGKLTTYRRMASDAVDQVTARLGLKRRCRTAKLALLGSDTHDVANDSDVEAAHLHGRFGSQARIIDAMIERDESLGAPLVEGLPYVRAEAIYAVRHEMATTLDDVLSRRTRARLFDARACRRDARAVAELMASELGWDAVRIDSEVSSMQSAIDGDLSGVGSSRTDDAEGEGDDVEVAMSAVPKGDH